MPDAESPAMALVRVPAGVLSHASAVRVHGLELVRPDPTECLTVPRNHSRVRLPGWAVRRAPLPPVDVQHRADGVRVTSPARTVVDLARDLPLAHAVAMADTFMRARLVEPPVLRARLDGQRGTGAAACRDVARLLDPAAGSVLESLLRVQLLTGPWDPPVTQHVVVDRAGRLAARVDFGWPPARLAVEADGFAFHSDRAAFRRDRERLNRLASLGWRVLRFTWEDVVDRPGYVAALVTECLRIAA